VKGSCNGPSPYVRDDSLRLHDILDAADSIQDFTKGKTREDLAKDKLLQSAILHQLYLIGEAAANVSSILKDSYHSVPWKLINGFRNYIAHEYFSLDLDIIWETALKDIPKLRAQIDEIVSREFP
jgi:uncharacterized protein with HEPN domain